MYVASPTLADSLGFNRLHTLLYNKYFVDEIYDATIVKPLVGGSSGCSGRAPTPG